MVSAIHRYMFDMEIVNKLKFSWCIDYLFSKLSNGYEIYLLNLCVRIVNMCHIYLILIHPSCCSYSSKFVQCSSFNLFILQNIRWLESFPYILKILWTIQYWMMWAQRWLEEWVDLVIGNDCFGLDTITPIIVGK